MWQGARTGRQILIYSPEPMGRRLLCNLVRHQGNAASAVATPEDALEAIESVPFSALIIEADAPGTAIFNLIKLVRFGRLGEPHLPVILITTETGHHLAERCEEASVDVCLLKPIDPAELQGAIAAVAGKSAGRNHHRK